MLYILYIDIDSSGLPPRLPLRAVSILKYKVSTPIETLIDIESYTHVDTSDDTYD